MSTTELTLAPAATGLSPAHRWWNRYRAAIFFVLPSLVLHQLERRARNEELGWARQLP
jgi:hypothetical protein